MAAPIEVVYDICMKCNWEFDILDRRPKKLKCGHFVCSTCFFRYPGNFQCFATQLNGNRCYEGTFRSEVISEGLRLPFERISELDDEVERLKNQVKQDAEIIAQKQKSQVKCHECKTHENETRIQVCKSCTSGEDAVGICAYCAIQNHVNKGHEIGDFFPILRSIKFKLHTENLKPARVSVQNANKKLENDLEELTKTIKEGEEQFNIMTEMIGKCKTTAMQQNLADRIYQRIRTNFQNLEKFRVDIGQFSDQMKTFNTELKAEINAEEAGNCVEESKEIKQEQKVVVKMEVKKIRVVRKRKCNPP